MIIDKELDYILSNISEVTLVGYYGANNFGDDLLLQSILNHLNKYNLKINIIGHGKIEWIDSEIKVGHWKENSKKYNFDMFKEITKTSQLILWGGGTCFTDEEGDGLFKYMVYSKVVSGKKIAYISIGIGNLKKVTSRLKTIILINLANYMSLREENSFSLAKKWCIGSTKKIKKTYDLAVDVIKAEKCKDKENKKGLLVSWRNLDVYPDKKVTTMELVEWCKNKCTEENLKNIVIIDADSTVDYIVSCELYKELKKELPNVEISYKGEKSYKEKLFYIKQNKYILTSRLHIGVVAYMLEKECYVYNYSPKIRYFVEECDHKNIKLLDESSLIRKY